MRAKIEDDHLSRADRAEEADHRIDWTKNAVWPALMCKVVVIDRTAEVGQPMLLAQPLVSLSASFAALKETEGRRIVDAVSRATFLVVGVPLMVRRTRHTLLSISLCSVGSHSGKGRAAQRRRVARCFSTDKNVGRRFRGVDFTTDKPSPRRCRHRLNFVA
uniref:Uncharacterized protein n=1 Tax=Plectus sambesii TaxID=2011161 RepID=A0A914W7N7_9BILA